MQDHRVPVIQIPKFIEINEAIIIGIKVLERHAEVTTEERIARTHSNAHLRELLLVDGPSTVEIEQIKTKLQYIILRVLD